MIGKTISHYKILEAAGGSGISICAFLLSLVIVVSGCGRSDTSIKLPGGAKVGDVKLEHFTYKTSGSAFKADRGVIVLPENRKKVGSRLIALPFVRIHTPISKPAEPIFFLSGGPGSPNIQSEAPGWVDSLLVNHDFVMVGYRGAEGSTILDCPEVKRALKGADDDLLSPESRAKLIEAMSSSAKRLQNEGIDISGYTIEEVAEDLDAVRFALDCERVSLLSMSYGTRVAQVYSYLHQDHLRRSVMVGANPPGHFVWEPKRIDEQLQQYSRLWEKDSVQAKRTNNLAETIRRVSHDMPKRWLFFPIDRGKVRVVTFSLLFHRNTAAMAFDAYVSAEKGDYSGLALMSMAYDFIVPSIGIWGDFFSKGSTDYDSSRDYASEMDPPGSIIGSPMSLLIWPAAVAHGSWPMVLRPDSIRHVQPSNVETLIISGNLDFSTPAESATQELLPALKHGEQIILKEMGHCGDLMGVQPQAFAHLLTSFYDSGTADASLFAYSPVDFRVRFGFPAIAKILVAVAALVLIVLAILVWFVAKRIQKRLRRLPAEL